MDKPETPAGSLRHRAGVASTVQESGMWAPRAKVIRLDTTLHFKQGLQRLDFSGESSFSGPRDHNPRTCSSPLISLADCYQSVAFQDLDVLTKVSICEFQS